MDFIKWAELGLGIAGVFGLFIVTLRGSLSGNTITLMKENKEAQDTAIKRLEDDAKIKADQISNLSGQVQILKDIPLAQIAKSLEVVTQMHLDFQAFFRAHDNQVQALADAAANKVINYLQSKDKQNG